MTSEFSQFAARLGELISLFNGGHCSVSALTFSRGRNPASQPAKGEPLSGGERGGDGALPSRHDAFNPLALELFALQFTHNAPYRRICEARRATPRSVRHWTQIPAVPASAFKELALSCLPAEERTIVFHSSGTTKQRPSRHFHSEESLQVYEASLWPWFRKHVVPDFQLPISDFQLDGESTNASGKLAIGNSDESRARAERCWQLAVLTPAPTHAPHSSLVHMFEAVRRKLAAPDSSFVGKLTADGTWAVDFDTASTALFEATEKNRALVLLGTAFSFVHLLDYLAQQRLEFALPPGSRVMEAGGYKSRSRTLSKPELHTLITERVGIPSSHVICEYGMSELSSQAYDLQYGASRITHHASRLFHFPPWARAQVISPETGREVAEGERGLLRIYDLANVFSVLAIQTDDLAVRQGDGFELIGRAVSGEPRGCSLMAA